MRICQCGCGEPIPPKPHHKWKPPQYLSGHYQRLKEFRERKSQRMRSRPPPDWEVPSGYCGCGCGRKTRIARNSSPARGIYYGFPYRYISGHTPSGLYQSGESHPAWKGGVTYRGGYRFLMKPGHRLANKKGYVAEHRLVWESTNGRELRPHEVVHHIDGDRLNNDPANLVALMKGEHSRLHASSPKHSERMRRWWRERKQAGS